MKINRVGVIIALLAATVGLWGQAPNEPAVPKEPGLYLYQDGHMIRVEGQVVSFARTGGFLASKVTFGVKSRKANVQILGRSARVTTVIDPTFYFREATDNEAVGGGVADLVLLRMKVHSHRRQVEVGAAGDWRASRGVSINSQVRFERFEIAPTVYRLDASGVRVGQYCFYLFRGNELPAVMYPFGVE